MCMRSTGQLQRRASENENRALSILITLTDVCGPWHLMHLSPFKTCGLNAIDDEPPHPQLTDDLSLYAVLIYIDSTSEEVELTSYNGRFLTRYSSVAFAVRQALIFVFLVTPRQMLGDILTTH